MILMVDLPKFYFAFIHGFLVNSVKQVLIISLILVVVKRRSQLIFQFK